MPGPFVGLGTTFEFESTGNPSILTVLAGVESVTFSGDKVSTDKTTTMLTTNGVDTYIGSTKEPGTVDIKGFYYPGDASQIAIEAVKNAGVAVQCQVIYPLGLGTATFLGIVENVTRGLPLAKVCSLDIKIKVTGAITYSQG
jgi:hypothetical protein